MNVRRLTMTGSGEPGNVAHTLSSYIPVFSPSFTGTSIENRLPTSFTGMGVRYPGSQYIWYGVGTGYARRRFSSETASGLGVSTRARPTPANVAGAATAPSTRIVSRTRARRGIGAYSPYASRNSCAKHGTGISLAVAS